jgi:DNA-binding GntR family transcriptional regulator
MDERAPGTFERVYAALRQQLRDGSHKPGTRLEPSALSDSLNASVTPVRDALHRLTGERLVEAPRHEGFRVPMVTESSLRHLYAWHHDLLRLALLNRKMESGAKEDVGTGARERCNALFLALAQATGNPEHVLALRSAIERLGPIQKLEDMLLDALESEADAILAALRSGDRKALRKALAHYHRRRERIVPELVEALQSGG